jgi:hypothetical protein
MGLNFENLYGRNAIGFTGVDNMRYAYEVLKPFLVPFFKKIILQRHDPDTFKYN